MRIFLIRHGEPEALTQDLVNAADFCKWLKQFNEVGLAPSAHPPEESLMAAAQCKAVVTSSMNRAHESARMLFPRKSILVEPLMNEFDLPGPSIPLLKLPPWLWLSLCRTVWYLGYCKDTETYIEARERARKAADLLIRLALYNKNIAYVGHGLMNNYIAHELRRFGWKGSIAPSREYWAVNVYTGPVEPVKSRPELCSGPEAI